MEENGGRLFFYRECFYRNFEDEGVNGVVEILTLFFDILFFFVFIVLYYIR